MIINDKTWVRLVDPIHSYSGDEYYAKLRETYGIKDMVAETKNYYTHWHVTFISEHARTIFMLKWGHLL